MIGSDSGSSIWNANTSPPASHRRLDRILTFTCATLFLITAASLIYSAYCQFMWIRMSMNDYGIYTNFLWNSAHGRPFLHQLDQNYLSTHLSFSLLLLAPLFRIWDHPFLLTVVYWVCGVFASLSVGYLAWRQRLSAPLIAAFLFFFLGCFYSQRALLCEFHGVCMYYVLLPSLYFCLVYRRNFVWLPLLLILTLREDAAFVAIPMLLYFAVADRWKAGYVYAAVALLYALLALKVIFPALTGLSITQRRGTLLDPGEIADSLEVSALRVRLLTIFWFFLPALPLLFSRKRWATLVFPSLALIILLASPLHYHHGLRRHYSASVFTCLALGMLESLRRSADDRNGTERRGQRALAFYLLGTTLVGHSLNGLLPTGGDSTDYFKYPLNAGKAALRAAQEIPKDGPLMVFGKLSGMCANRPDVFLWSVAGGRETQAEYIFFTYADLLKTFREPLMNYLTNSAYGVISFDENTGVLKKGSDTSRNQEILRAVDNIQRTITFAKTQHAKGKTRTVARAGELRYWVGDGSRSPCDLSHGASKLLPPGSYRARFKLAASEPDRVVRGSWGWLSVHELGQQDAIAKAEIDHVPGCVDEPRVQDLYFTLNTETRVEPRVTGADAELWLYRVVYDPIQADPYERR